MKTTIRGRHTARLGVALLVLSILAPISPATADESAHAGDAAPQTHLVRAGANNPVDPATGEPSPEHFVYTAYYPQRLQVHRGDTVRWEMLGGYGGWHTVTFKGRGSQPAPAMRHDEAPRTVAFTQEWLHGGAPGGPCGRSSWWDVSGVPDQDPCVLTDAALDGPHEGVSSSIWDRFASMPDSNCPECLSPDHGVGAAWVAKVELSPGTYDYYCRLHPQMKGSLEVLPAEQPLDNPTSEETAQQVAHDYANAKATAAKLGDAATAYDPDRGEWVVNVGGDTDDRRVEILDFLPGVLPDARPGDRVRFVAHSQEPNSVVFHAAPTVAGRDAVQGGFSATGSCDIDGCTTDDAFTPVGPFSPWGLTGFAFVWQCDYDDPAGGAPGVPLAWIPPRITARTGGAVDTGCPDEGGTAATVELTVGSTMTERFAAAGDAVVPGAVHSSGMLMDDELPGWYRNHPDGTPFPSDFTANFPVSGSFPYICINHEFMRGRIDVG